jgi:hypothetical protein
MPPGLEMIADENGIEARFFGRDCKVEKIARTKLFR